MWHIILSAIDWQAVGSVADWTGVVCTGLSATITFGALFAAIFPSRLRDLFHPPSVQVEWHSYEPYVTQHEVGRWLRLKVLNQSSSRNMQDVEVSLDNYRVVDAQGVESPMKKFVPTRLIWTHKYDGDDYQQQQMLADQDRLIFHSLPANMSRFVNFARTMHAKDSAGKPVGPAVRYTQACEVSHAGSQVEFGTSRFELLICADGDLVYRWQWEASLTQDGAHLKPLRDLMENRLSLNNRIKKLLTG